MVQYTQTIRRLLLSVFDQTGMLKIPSNTKNTTVIDKGARHYIYFQKQALSSSSFIQN